MTRVLLAAFALIATGFTAAYAQDPGGTPAATVTTPSSPPAPAPDPTSGLSAARLAGARVIAAWDGTTPPAALRKGLASGTLGGVIVFRSNIGSRNGLRRTLSSLQGLKRPAGLRAPLLVMIDQEGGIVKRLDGAPSRSPAQLGALDSVATTRAEGLHTAANLRSAGVNVNLAPVVDLGRAGSYQRRTGRAYGSNPALVSRHGVAFVRGLRAGGVRATLKHFAGLGAVALDEDLRLQTIRLPLDTLRGSDEAPFKAAIAAGADLVMTSTGIYTAIDSSTPAMLSRKVVVGELRGRLGFTGVTITDSLDVTALAGTGPERLALASARAGEDILLYTSLGGAIRGSRALTQAYKARTLSRTEFRAAARRVLALRAAIVP